MNRTALRHPVLLAPVLLAPALLAPVLLAVPACAASGTMPGAAGRSAMTGQYPGCDLSAQRELAAPTGGAVSDPRQAHISIRAKILQADIATARTARHLSRDKADRLWGEVADITRQTNDHVGRQGFLSAGERAGYDHALDAIARQICP